MSVFRRVQTDMIILFMVLNRVLDGGIYDDPDVSIFEALNNVCEDYFKKDSIYEVTDYDELVEKSNDAEIEYVNKHRMTR